MLAFMFVLEGHVTARSFRHLSDQCRHNLEEYHVHICAATIPSKALFNIQPAISRSVCIMEEGGHLRNVRAHSSLLLTDHDRVVHVSHLMELTQGFLYIVRCRDIPV